MRPRFRSQRLYQAVTSRPVEAGHAADMGGIGTVVHELRQGILQGRGDELAGVALREFECFDQALGTTV